MKKLFYLFLALLLPGLAFVFLKYAGKNEFNVPVYYGEGVQNPPKDCNRDYTVPYLIPDAILRATSDNNQEVHILVFPMKDMEAVSVNSLMEKVQDEFGSEAVWLKDARNFMTDSLTYAELKNCIFLIGDPWQAVAFDRKGQIRGYYDIRLREEVDRLRVELKILLKKY